ncbi:MAG: threonine--tRNA ligase [Rickettsiales bacterium]|nr:threonine--tRNA ligase [Rickettsiales bacterium]
MLKITFPDGKHKNYEPGVTGNDIASDISLSLSKVAIAILVNGSQKDLSDPINEDALVNIITLKDESGLEIMRHTTAAQVLARAIKNIYPDAKLAIGPTIENGFYYDVLLKNSISSEDLSSIEKEMKKIVKEGHLIKKKIKKKNEVIQLFESLNEPYKIQIINDSLQENDFQIYQQGETNFFDLCKGPHLPSLKLIGEFKLTKVSGAYWRGDAKNEMLQRIYGTAWRNKKELDLYLSMLEEAEKRDHRKIGKEMSLFHFQDDAPGSVFWHPKGWSIFNQLVDYMRGKQENAGYTEISTPTVLDRSLWERSGHWEKFQDNMYLAKTSDEKIFALKPMNCPGGIQIYNNGLRSYRDLPLRIAEFGKVFRFEPSGALHGLMRVREFTQDDAHIYCLKEQMEEECEKVINLTLDIYKDFGFENVKIKFSDRPEKRIGDDDTWDFLEKSLLSSLKKLNLKFNVNKGEGAFYGPKIEFVLVDAIGREWQCGTLQVDLNLPPRLGANFIDKDGSKKHPVMLHRAFFGSLERFIGILIENYAGRLPNWLAPVQVAIATINDNCIEYSKTLGNYLSKDGIKFKFDFRNEKLNYKIRDLSLEKVPYIVVIGEKEILDKTISLRSFPENKLVSMQLNEFLKKIKKSCSIE